MTQKEIKNALKAIAKPAYCDRRKGSIRLKWWREYYRPRINAEQEEALIYFARDIGLPLPTIHTGFMPYIAIHIPNTE
jgi:hypothetical protein